MSFSALESLVLCMSSKVANFSDKFVTCFCNILYNFLSLFKLGHEEILSNKTLK